MAKYTNGQRRAALRCIVEGRRILAGIGFRDSALRVAYCLFGVRRTWSISAVSQATGLTRDTARKVLRQWERAGFAKRQRRGYRITDAGAAYTRASLDTLLQDNRRAFRALCASLRDD